jgi:hypothetical protein
MDAIVWIVTIGMSGGPRATVRHLSFTRFWADRLAALADRNRTGSHLARWRANWRRDGASLPKPISGAG